MRRAEHLEVVVAKMKTWRPFLKFWGLRGCDVLSIWLPSRRNDRVLFIKIREKKTQPKWPAGKVKSKSETYFSWAVLAGLLVAQGQLGVHTHDPRHAIVFPSTANTITQTYPISKLVLEILHWQQRSVLFSSLFYSWFSLNTPKLFQHDQLVSKTLVHESRGSFLFNKSKLYVSWLILGVKTCEVHEWRRTKKTMKSKQ